MLQRVASDSVLTVYEGKSHFYKVKRGSRGLSPSKFLTYQNRQARSSQKQLPAPNPGPLLSPTRRRPPCPLLSWGRVQAGEPGPPTPGSSLAGSPGGRVPGCQFSHLPRNPLQAAQSHLLLFGVVVSTAHPCIWHVEAIKAELQSG